MRHSRRVWALSGALLVSVLAGCGGDEAEQNGAWPDSTAGATGAAGVASGSPEVASPAVEVPGKADAPTVPEPKVEESPMVTPSPGATESKARATKAPVKVEEKADFGEGMSAEITGTKAVTVTDVVPGEIAGPAVAVTVTYRNTGSKPVSLESAIVSLNYNGQEASAFSGEPAKEAPETVAPGSTETGVYVFAVPADQRSKVKIRVSYSPTAPQVVFEGAVA